MLDNVFKDILILKSPRAARQAAALHRERYRSGFHIPTSLAAAQARMKFAVSHNIPAFGQTKRKQPNFTASDKVTDWRTESSRLYKRSNVVFFLAGLDISSALQSCCLSVENGVLCKMIMK